MGKQIRKVLILTGVATLVLFGGAMTSYAVGPGEKASQTAVANPTTYNQQAVKALGSWEQQGSVWRFHCLNGTYISNSWLESLSELGAYYYVDSDGVMLTNSKTPDGYVVDANGLWRSQTVVQDTSRTGNDGTNKQSGLYVDENGVQHYEATEEEIAMVREYFQGVSRYDGIH